jgi:hypothetical protein
VVYGTIDASSGGVVTNYSIDGAPPAQMTSQRGAVDVGRQQFWASPSLNVSQQSVVVFNQSKFVLNNNIASYL